MSSNFNSIIGLKVVDYLEAQFLENDLFSSATTATTTTTMSLEMIRVKIKESQYHSTSEILSDCKSILELFLLQTENEEKLNKLNSLLNQLPAVLESLLSSTNHENTNASSDGEINGEEEQETTIRPSSNQNTIHQSEITHGPPGEDEDDDEEIGEEYGEINTLSATNNADSAEVAEESSNQGPHQDDVPEEEEDVKPLKLYLPCPKPNRRTQYVMEPLPPTTRFQFDPEPNEDIVRLAEKARIPLDHIALPCFAVPIVNKDTRKTCQRYDYKRLRPSITDDLSCFEPKNRKDMITMETVYRKIFVDHFEKTLQHGTSHLVTSDVSQLEEDEFDRFAFGIQEVKDIFKLDMPAPEFYVMFSSYATQEQKDRFSRTRLQGGAQMAVQIQPYSEIRKVLGMAAIRVLIHGTTDKYVLLGENICLSLRNNIVTVRTTACIVNFNELPKEYAKWSSSRQMQKGYGTIPSYDE
jgi:hypothetical protein